MRMYAHAETRMECFWGRFKKCPRQLFASSQLADVAARHLEIHAGKEYSPALVRRVEEQLDWMWPGEIELTGPECKSLFKQLETLI